MATQVDAEKKTLGFQTEVKRLLDLMINSLYSNKEIFLRELISNASDAADKLRFAAIADPQLYEQDSELKIHVNFDKDKRTISIIDNGIGMSREDVIEHLGTIAKSGTRDFINQLTQAQAKDTNLIGQFGVGFYSAFIVADKVTVITRRAGLTPQQGVQWESDGKGEYTIENIERQQRGTEVILHLRADEDELLNDWRLRNIITKYSNHIGFPIVMQKSIDEEKKGNEITEETVNRATALWALPKSEIKETDYNEFYKTIAHDYRDPLVVGHFKVEGKQEYTCLFFIPEHAPYDLYQRDQKHGLKLYVRRVFIMDDVEQFLPSYLRFVKGIIDSNDLPLNISREILQSNKIIDTMRATLTKRVLGILEKLAQHEPDKYTKFWGEFGKILKEGPGEDYTNREEIAKLLRFASSYNDTEAQKTTLDDYIKRMKPEQEKIYYVTAENYKAAIQSPHLEIFHKKGIEVLLLTERVDEWLVSHLTEFAGKSLQSVAKGDLDLGNLADEETKQKQKAAEDEYASLLKQAKETLGDKVKEVKITYRLTDSPACIVVDEHELGGQMQRILKAAGHAIPNSQPILELNPEHPLVIRLKNEQDETRFSQWVWILLEQAILAEGGQLEEPGRFVQRLNELLLAKY